MAPAAVSYDRSLPEIPGRRAWEEPISYLVKDPSAPDGWRIEESGRRPSDLQLVPAIRAAVDDWRQTEYPGASEVTRELFRYWFEDEHEIAGFDVPLRYHFAQREAIETFVWLMEVARAWDAADLIQRFARSHPTNLGTLPSVGTGADGQRHVRWKGADGVVRDQALPPPNLRRYAFRMATGSGKTWVMALAVVWSHLHRRLVPNSPASTNFLIVAPNVIVYERLRKDFEGNRIFHRLPLIPPPLRQHFDQRVILRGDPTQPAPSGNLFLTNIQQLYPRTVPAGPENPVQNILGPPPGSDATEDRMLDRILSLRDLIALNDEAHHVHDDDLMWTKTLLRLHETLPDGLAGWLDFSATPKDLGGQFFPWVVCDYPLPQAVEDRIVKAPVIVETLGENKEPLADPAKVTAKDASERYGPWLRAAVQRFTKIEKALEHVPVRPILFVMAEVNAHANAIAEALTQEGDFAFASKEVLVIHTDATGDTKGNAKKLEALRRAARDVDDAASPVRVIVSVMMLREGWDVRNVSVVVGLRAFTAKSNILPEQVIGRGLRLMRDLGPDRTQTLEVFGTTRLLKTVRDQLETEGVGFTVVQDPPKPPVTIQPLRERIAYDISLPDLPPDLRRDPTRLPAIAVESLPPAYKKMPRGPVENIRAEFATTGTELHEEKVTPAHAVTVERSLARITGSLGAGLGLPGHFAVLYPIVRRYVAEQCFGVRVELASQDLALALTRSQVRDEVTETLIAELGKRTVVEPALAEPPVELRLFNTRAFTWRRNLPPLEAVKTVFNYVATYNRFERRFAEFLDRASDVARFAALAATEQGSAGVQFRIVYLKPGGAIGHYYPDWVVVGRDGGGESFWIIETKGREFAGTKTKDAAARRWCARASRLTGHSWAYYRVNQLDFDAIAAGAKSFAELLGRCHWRHDQRLGDRRLNRPWTLEELRTDIEKSIE